MLTIRSRLGPPPSRSPSKRPNRPEVATRIPSKINRPRRPTSARSKMRTAERNARKEARRRGEVTPRRKKANPPGRRKRRCPAAPDAQAQEEQEIRDARRRTRPPSARTEPRTSKRDSRTKPKAESSRSSKWRMKPKPKDPGTRGRPKADEEEPKKKKKAQGEAPRRRGNTSQIRLVPGDYDQTGTHPAANAARRFRSFPGWEFFAFKIRPRPVESGALRSFVNAQKIA